MRKLKKIILVTGAPASSGLAYYHYLAFRDIGNYPVEIIDNGQATYSRGVFRKIGMRLRTDFGLGARRQLERILCSIKENPQRVAVILYHLGCLRAPEILKLHGLGVTLYGYFSDSPFGMQPDAWNGARKVLPLLNSVFTFLNNLVPVFYQYGARRVCCVPFGYCRYTHLMADEQLRRFDGRIYYFGTYGPLIEKWLQPLLKFNLVIHGHDWKNAKSPAIRKAAMWDVAHDRKMSETASGQLVVNFIRAQHGAGHSLKTFELPAAGACVITNRSEEQLEFFPEDSNISYFDTKSEMESLVRDFIKSPERIQQQLHKRKLYLEKQSYHERVVIILEELEDSFKQRIPEI